MTKICPKNGCGKQHEKPGIFCSRSCANSKVRTEETIRKASAGVSNWWKNLPEGDKLERRRKMLSGMEKRTKIFHEKIMSADFSTLSFVKKRFRVLCEQNHCCKRCGISEWLGEPITLELEHKNGKNKDDTRENLEALCPNCHSLTPTWRGRNNKNRKYNYRKRMSTPHSSSG